MSLLRTRSKNSAVIFNQLFKTTKVARNHVEDIIDDHISHEDRLYILSTIQAVRRNTLHAMSATRNNHLGNALEEAKKAEEAAGDIIAKLNELVSANEYKSLSDIRELFVVMESNATNIVQMLEEMIREASDRRRGGGTRKKRGKKRRSTRKCQ
jgi:hypothetical protein